MVKRKVQRVVDGDTFDTDKPVCGSTRIRIAGINTPEKGQRGYLSSTNKLKKEIEGKIVDIKPVGKSYGRTVANVKKSGRKIPLKRKKKSNIK